MNTLMIVFTIVAFITCAIIFQENAPFVLNKIKGLGWLAPILFLLIYCLATVLLLPTMVLTLAGGALFGPILGTLFNLLGATLGATCAFGLSRYFAFDWLASKNRPKLNKLIAGVERNGWQFAAFLRLIPIVPFNLVNYGLGLTRIKFSHYVMTTFFFLAPAEIIYTYCGYAGMDALSNRILFYKNETIFALLGLAFLFVLFKLFCFYRQRLKN
ncbi:MAG: TVP38/TMEM64 family protein [Tatlockia sp.]|nr:TVP38/TMEM64 family protein [Tatlockia sp.]